MKFKHKLLLSGTEENINKFCRELVKMGYSPSGCFSNEGVLTCNYHADLRVATNHLYLGYEISYIDRTTNLPTNDYCSLNLNNTNEYSAAMAIASIVDAEEFSKGEILYTVKDDGNNAGVGSLAEVVSPYVSKTYFKNTNGMGVGIKWINILPKNPSNGQHDGEYYADYFRKATPEEILNFYTQKTKIMSKVLIGFEALSNIEGVKIGQKVYVEKGYEGDTYHIFYTRGDVINHVPDILIGECKRYPEFWKPIYEDDLPDHVTVLVGSPGKEIIVYRNSKNINLAGEATTTIDQISALKRTLNGGMGKIADFCVIAKSVWIGCEDKGTLVTSEDVGRVVEEWGRLNP